MAKTPQNFAYLTIYLPDRYIPTSGNGTGLKDLDKMPVNGLVWENV